MIIELETLELFNNLNCYVDEVADTKRSTLDFFWDDLNTLDDTLFGYIESLDYEL